MEQITFSTIFIFIYIFLAVQAALDFQEAGIRINFWFKCSFVIWPIMVVGGVFALLVHKLYRTIRGLIHG